MSAIGGPVQAISIDGREFKVTADADIGRKMGGFENEYQSNGDGTARLIKKVVPWALGSVTVEIDDDRNDQEYLEDKKDAQKDLDISITMASGKVYAGTGQITGELSVSSANASASFELTGPGKLKAI